MRFVFLIAVAALAGCSTVYEGKYDFRDDWRKATVIQVVALSALAQKKDPYCSKGTSRIERSDQVIVLSYKQFNRTRTTVRPILKDDKLLPGSVVYVNMSHCDWAIVLAQ